MFLLKRRTCPPKRGRMVSLALQEAESTLALDEIIGRNTRTQSYKLQVYECEHLTGCSLPHASISLSRVLRSRLVFSYYCARSLSGCLEDVYIWGGILLNFCALNAMR